MQAINMRMTSCLLQKNWLSSKVLFYPGLKRLVPQPHNLKYSKANAKNGFFNILFLTGIFLINSMLYKENKSNVKYFVIIYVNLKHKILTFFFISLNCKKTFLSGSKWSVCGSKWSVHGSKWSVCGSKWSVCGSCHWRSAHGSKWSVFGS